MERIVKVSDLRKVYKKEEVLKGITFDISQGEIFAMLGPNGAGKSTTMNILSTATKATSGKVIIDGLPLGGKNISIKKKIGIVFQDGILDNSLSVKENLYIRGRLYGLYGKILEERISQISLMTGTNDLLKYQYGKLSGGQKRRCDIARALLHLPKLLFLDEPTTGLDPEMRSAVWETINNIRYHSNMTILLTTHYMEEATRADQTIFLKNGKIVARGTPRELKETLTSDSLIIYTNTASSIANLLKLNDNHFDMQNGKIKILLNSTMDAIPILNMCHGKFSSFEVQCGNLEDAYISIIEGESLNV